MIYIVRAEADGRGSNRVYLYRWRIQRTIYKTRHQWTWQDEGYEFAHHFSQSVASLDQPSRHLDLRFPQPFFFFLLNLLNWYPLPYEAPRPLLGSSAALVLDSWGSALLGRLRVSKEPARLVCLVMVTEDEDGGTWEYSRCTRFSLVCCWPSWVWNESMRASASTWMRDLGRVRVSAAACSYCLVWCHVRRIVPPLLVVVPSYCFGHHKARRSKLTPWAG